jgi:hypothetical protein
MTAALFMFGCGLAVFLALVAGVIGAGIALLLAAIAADTLTAFVVRRCRAVVRKKWP